MDMSAEYKVSLYLPNESELVIKETRINIEHKKWRMVNQFMASNGMLIIVWQMPCRIVSKNG